MLAPYLLLGSVPALTRVVAGVVLKDTGRDVSDLFNEVGPGNGVDPVELIGGAIAESGLRACNPREGTWPDVSYDLYQRTVKWYGKLVPGVALGADGYPLDTADNRARFKAYWCDPERSIRDMGPRYAALRTQYGSALEAWCRWNKPALPGSQNPNRITYQLGLAAAEAYRIEQHHVVADPATSAYRPKINASYGTIGGTFGGTPRGAILHASRSGLPKSTAQELADTDAWAKTPSNVLGWNVTIGDDEYSEHIGPTQWGWNAFAASEVYLAAEFAQSGAGGVFQPISDGQVRAYCYWLARRARVAWPRLPLHMPSHSDVEHTGEIQHTPSGKTDVFPYGDPRTDELRGRILARLKSEYGIT